LASTCHIEQSASAELLACILEGAPWPDYLLRRALIEDEGRMLFSVVIERLGDLFEPALCDEYARLFSRVVELLRPEWKALDLVGRYERVRKVRPCKHKDVKTVFVLSRVTLGADVAVTSVIMDSVKRRFPQSSIRFVGPRKNFELFAEDPRILHMPFSYPRSGSLVDRLKQWGEFFAPDSIVVDPDSRLTQLGILPVCDEKDYFFFESRCYYSSSNEPLPKLASRWAWEVFNEPGRAWIAPEQQTMPAEVAVSLGVGENADKRLEDPFEEDLLRALIGRGFSVIVDEGGGGEEAERVRALQQKIPELQIWTGSFAGFASLIAQAQLYVGYDSAGQHIAAARGVPLVSIFAGFPTDRMFERWQPWGPGPRQIVKVEQRDSAIVLNQAIEAVDALMGRRNA